MIWNPSHGPGGTRGGVMWSAEAQWAPHKAWPVTAVSETRTSRGGSLISISSLNSSVNKFGQKATENFISNYQTPLKLKFPRAFLRKWVSLINNDSEWDALKELSFLEKFVNPAGRVCSEMLFTSGFIICFFSLKPMEACRKYESLLLNYRRAKTKKQLSQLCWIPSN